jgi:hypothetical protein
MKIIHNLLTQPRDAFVTYSLKSCGFLSIVSK